MSFDKVAIGGAEKDFSGKISPPYFRMARGVVEPRDRGAIIQQRSFFAGFFHSKFVCACCCGG